MGYMPSKPQALSQLELYELFVALYPDKFPVSEEGDDEEGLWGKVLAYVEEVTQDDGSDDNPVLDLLARIVYLAPLMQSPLTKTNNHVLGKPYGEHGFMAVLKRVPNQ